MARILRTADEVVEALGGPTRAAEALGLKPNTVGNWKIRDEIAPHNYILVTRALEAMGIRVDPSVFGMLE